MVLLSRRYLSFLLLITSSSVSRVIALENSDDNDLELVKNYVISHANDTFREPSGILKFPYLVPAGPYDQCWDWDSVFTGVALFELGSAPYLAGSMMNFLEATNGSGFVTQCLDPSTNKPSCSSSNESTPVDAHAKPLIIQGAYIAARYMNNFAQFYPYKEKMQALLQYWDTERKDPLSGLYTWHDQMESGADNLVTSQCPTSRSDCWNEATDANTLASSDGIVELIREEQAYLFFLSQWSSLQLLEENSALSQERNYHSQRMSSMVTSLNDQLWKEEEGGYVALNVSTQLPINNIVYLAAFPLFGGSSVVNQSQANMISTRLNNTDMMSKFGIRSTSSKDPRFSNANTIYPYSNWRGPIWVVANAVIAYGLMEFGHTELATQIASSITSVLANDLRNTDTWHECYDSGTEDAPGEGEGLAAEGFLSWNTLGFRLSDDIANGVNPFSLKIA